MIDRNSHSLPYRNTTSISKLRGSVGAVRSLSLHPDEPYLASAGLDRHLRIHNTQTRECEHKFYLKNKLNCAVFMKERVSAKEDEEDVWEALQETAPNVKRRKV